MPKLLPVIKNHNHGPSPAMVLNHDTGQLEVGGLVPCPFCYKPDVKPRIRAYNCEECNYVGEMVMTLSNWMRRRSAKAEKSFKWDPENGQRKRSG